MQKYGLRAYKCKILQICEICEGFACRTPDLTAAVRSVQVLKYAVLHICINMRKMSKYAKYGKEVFTHAYAANSIFSYMFPCAAVCLLSMVPQSGE